MKTKTTIVLVITFMLLTVIIPLASFAAAGSVPRPGHGVQEEQKISSIMGALLTGDKTIQKQKYSPSLITKAFFAASELYNAYKSDDIADAWSFTRSVITSSIVYNDASAVVGTEEWSKSAHLCLTKMECGPAFEILNKVYGDMAKSGDSFKQGKLLLTPYHAFAVIVTEELIYKLKNNINLTEILVELEENNGKPSAPPSGVEASGASCVLMPPAGGVPPTGMFNNGAGGQMCSISSFSDPGSGGDIKAELPSSGDLGPGKGPTGPDGLTPGNIKSTMDIKAFFMQECQLDTTKLGGNVGDPGEGDGGEGGEPEGGGEASGGTSPEDEQKAWQQKTEAELKHMQDVIQKMEDGFMSGNNEGLSAAWQNLINAANAASSQQTTGNSSGPLERYGKNSYHVDMGIIDAIIGKSGAGKGGGGFGGPEIKAGPASIVLGGGWDVYSHGDRFGVYAYVGVKGKFTPVWDSDSVQSACGKSGRGGGLSGFFSGCFQNSSAKGFMWESSDGRKYCPYCNPADTEKDSLDENTDGGKDGDIIQQGGSGNSGGGDSLYASSTSSSINYNYMVGNDTCWLWVRYGGVLDPLPTDPGTGGSGGGNKCDSSGLGGKPSKECCEENPAFPGCGGGSGPDPIYQEATSPEGDLY